MKKSEIAIATILILLIAVILVGVFFGFHVFGFGQPQYPHNAQPPLPNATLFEKAEWEEKHGSICQCIIPLEFVGPIVLFPGTEKTISNISFNLSLFPGETPKNITNASFTLSTKNTERTVRYGDPSVTVYWIRSTNDAPDAILKNSEFLHVDLDIEKMGFASSALGPNERFSLIITPVGWYRLAATRTTPELFSPGIPIEISLRL